MGQSTGNLLASSVKIAVGNKAWRFTSWSFAVLGTTALLVSPAAVAWAAEHNDLPSEGSAAQRVATQLHQSRPFPRLTLDNGEIVEYLGMFAPDAKFRRPSRFNRLRDTEGAQAVPGWQQNEQPVHMLRSNERVVENYVPPKHAIAAPQVYSPVHDGVSSIATAVFGHARVLGTPHSVTTDSKGRVILTDPSIPAVHVLEPTGKGSFRIVGGPGMYFQAPSGVAVDANDNIYVADSSEGKVLVFDAYGRFLREIGTFYGEPLYQSLTGIAIDRTAGHLYVADGPRHMIFMLDLEGNILRRAGRGERDGRPGELQRRDSIAPREFNYPRELALSNHEVFVLDSGGTRIGIMDMNCNLVGSITVQHAARDRASGLSVGGNGEIYVSYPDNPEVRVYSRDGTVLGSFGEPGFRMGEFNAPEGLWVDSYGRFYIADAQNARVQLFQLSTPGKKADDPLPATGSTRP